MPNHGQGPFDRQGELQLSKNRRFLKHAGGKPFFWLADTVWCGPLLAHNDDWRVFLQDRVDKEFTAIQFVMTQWRMAKTDAAGNSTYWGTESPSQFIAAAKSPEGDLAVIYLPEGGTIRINTRSLREGVIAQWYHPRTGGWLAADKVTRPTQIFKPADLNDWVLLFRVP